MMVEKETVMVAAVYDWPIEVQCRICGVEYVTTVNSDDFRDWYNGISPIQNAFHYLSASERELILSETCGKCFDKMFPPDLDNDE
jgi:hypothetical protein